MKQNNSFYRVNIKLLFLKNIYLFYSFCDIFTKILQIFHINNNRFLHNFFDKILRSNFTSSKIKLKICIYFLIENRKLLENKNSFVN